MSDLLTLARQTETIQGYQLTSQTDMLTALTYITAGGYIGQISYTDQSTWLLYIQNASLNTHATATIGDWIIIENNAVVTVCPQDKFASLYHT